MDLRQLGNIVYAKTKSKKSRASDIDMCNATAEDGSVISSHKRVRKERVIMMDGKGTGYGGNIFLNCISFHQYSNSNDIMV